MTSGRNSFKDRWLKGSYHTEVKKKNRELGEFIEDENM